MQPKTDGEPAQVVVPVYKPLPPEYKPIDASEYDLALIQRIMRKRR